MKRTKTKQTRRPDAILSADIHLSETIPVSRTDNYHEAQSSKLMFLRDLQAKYECPVLDAGDIFNYWKPSPWLLSRAYHLLPDDMVTIPGNHDLPEHSSALYHKSGLAVLDAVDKLTVLLSETLFDYGILDIHGTPYGGDIGCQKGMKGNGKRKMLILHEMVWPDKTPPWPGAGGIPAIDLLKQFHDIFDLILTGHHHVAFTVEYKGSLLVNPGPMMRISADKADYKPRCYLYFADDNSVEAVFYPIESDVHDTSHIDQVKERNERLEAYIGRMNMEWESGLSFQGNLESFFKRNKTPKKVKELIYQNLEEEK